LAQDGLSLSSVASPRYGDYDAVIVVTDHDALDRRQLLREASVIIDTRDALREVEGDRSKVFGL
jgi:UDP-N-acetyl-D-glucosamine dehydrogenase